MSDSNASVPTPAPLDVVTRQLQQVATTGRELILRSQHAEVLLAALKEREELRRDLGEVIDERDAHAAAADKLAYAIAPVEVIGEHSSGNDPWENALDHVVAAKRARELEQEIERLTRDRDEGTLREMALHEQLDQSAGHTAEECEADAIQAEYETLQKRAERLEAAAQGVIDAFAIPSGGVGWLARLADLRAALAGAPAEEGRDA